MIYLLTGSPGSGKTLSAMDWMQRVKDEDAEQPDRSSRMIYAANIEGLSMPGVLPLDDDGVRSWHQVCEKNSIIFVDEAQRYWRAQRSGEPSQAIIEMETHRHDGIDIVLMTQHPTFIHANIRKLVNVHIHLIAFSKSSALRYEWRECHDDVQDSSLRQTGDFKEWNYPVKLYQYYKSATLHTKRAKRPLKMVVAKYVKWASLVVFLLALACVGVFVMRGAKAFSQAKSVDLPGSVRLASGGQSSSGSRQAVQWASPGDYAKAQIPRIPTQPWSAPIYDSGRATAHPQIWCVAQVPPGKCGCITEQGTHYDLSDGDCRTVARDGMPYDPFRPREVDRSRDRSGGAQDVQQATQRAASALPGIPAPVVGVSGSRATAIAYTPPEEMPWNPNDIVGKEK